MAKDFLIFLEKLNDEGVEFVIVGGVAARLYGSTRLTHDVDVVPDLTPESWRKTVECIWEMGGRPRISESIADKIRRNPGNETPVFPVSGAEGCG